MPGTTALQVLYYSSYNVGEWSDCKQLTLPRMAVMSVPVAVSDALTESLHSALKTRKASFCKAASICSWAEADSLGA